VQKWSVLGCHKEAGWPRKGRAACLLQHLTIWDNCHWNSDGVETPCWCSLSLTMVMGLYIYAQWWWWRGYALDRARC